MNANMLPFINIHETQTVILCSVKHSYPPRPDSHFLNLELKNHQGMFTPLVGLQVSEKSGILV